jgi:hypothetical protein
MEKITRRRVNADGWREILGRQEQSGLSAREFCQREGIAVGSLYRWRSRVGERAASPEPSGRPRAAACREFIDVGALGSSASRFEVRLDLGGGLSLHLVRS